LKFLSPLDTRKIGAQRWLLLDDLVFKSDYLKGILIAPRGFQTDLASIPRIFWAIAPKEDIYDPAAVIHDAAYGHALVTNEGNRIELIKPLADKMFLEAMLCCGVSSWRAHIMYQAVSIFGNPSTHPLVENTVNDSIS